MKIRITIAATLAVALAPLASGCGEGGPALVSVSGTVTINGKPLEGAIVQFVPDPAVNKEGRTAEDITGPEGNYKLMTGGRSGIVPGKYNVNVTKAAVAVSSKVAEQFKDDPFMAQMSSNPPTAGNAKPKNASEAIEFKVEREVPAGGGVQDIDVKATSKAAAKAEAPKAP